MLTREAILKALEAALKPLDYVQAMWQGGSASFNRVDEWSDIDLQVIADDDRTADVVAAVEDVLRGLSPIGIRYELPQPSWHGHTQIFYQLQDAGPFLMIDFVVIKVSNPNRFLEREIHGDAVVVFDKIGIVKSPPFSVENHLRQIEGRLETLKVTFDLFQPLVQKEIYRHNAIDAFSFYQSFTLRPLVEVLRIQYDPSRYNFGTRYLYYILPPEVIQRLEPLFFVADIDQLLVNFDKAQQFFRETLEGIDLKTVEQKLNAMVV